MTIKNYAFGGSKMTKMILAVAVGCLFASSALASGPVALSEAQMDKVTAGGAPSPNGFVCPVISTSAVLNSPRGMEIGEGHYSIIGPAVRVPIHATNGAGAGTPMGPHSAPGDRDYTAIWHTP